MRITSIICCTIFAVFRITESRRAPGQTKRIVNGDFAGIENYPYIAQITRGGIFGCRGTIISPKWILTAANCVVEGEQTLKPALFGIWLGSTTKNNGTYYDVQQIQTHEHDDIAMMQIRGTIKFGPTVAMVHVGHVERPSEDYKNCMTAGWGMSDVDNRSLVDLQVLELQTIPMTECSPWGRVHVHICVLALKEEAAPCFGDSGGPLMCDGIQVGLLSFGSRKCDPAQPEVYTLVPAYYSWIRKILRKFNGDPNYSWLRRSISATKKPRWRDFARMSIYFPVVNPRVLL